MVNWYTCKACGASFDRVYRRDHDREHQAPDYLEGMYQLATGDLDGEV